MYLYLKLYYTQFSFASHLLYIYQSFNCLLHRLYLLYLKHEPTHKLPTLSSVLTWQLFYAINFHSPSMHGQISGTGYIITYQCYKTTYKNCHWMGSDTMFDKLETNFWWITFITNSGIRYTAPCRYVHGPPFIGKYLCTLITSYTSCILVENLGV